MADSRKDAKRRASFGRADRMQRTEGNTAKGPTRQVKRSAPRAAENKRQLSPMRYFVKKLPPRKHGPTPLELSRERVGRQWRREGMKRVAGNTKASFNRLAERRQDLQKRQEVTRHREAMRIALKRSQEVRRRYEQRQITRRKDQTRQSFNRQAESRKAVASREAEARQAEQKKAAQRIASQEIDREHKRRQVDEQAQHRRETDTVRLRHQAAMRSMESHELSAENRHHHAIQRLDAAEGRELDAFDANRATLKNRIIERIMGPSKGDEQRHRLQQRHEAERFREHQKLEATKERMFKAAQDMRLSNAHERLRLMERHHADRQKTQEQHQHDRPRLIEDRSRTVMEATRQRTAERENTNERQHTEERSWFIPAKVG